MRALHKKLVLPVLALGLVFACNQLPKRGPDGVAVTIGDAAVFRRERFLGDRYEDLRWLREQLTEKKLKEYEQGLQGSSNVLYRSQIGFAARAAFDAVAGVTLSGAAAAGAAPAGDSSEDANGTEDGATSDSDATGTGESGEDPPVTPPNSGGGGSDEVSPTPVESGSLETAFPFSDEELGDEILARIGAAPQVSPQDLLRDRLAFRDEVRSAIRQRDLDDTHDLQGSSLYELSFDLTLAAGEDPGSAYVVTLTPEEHSADLPASLPAAVLSAMEREVVYTAWIFGQRIQEGHLTARDGELIAASLRRGSLAAYVGVMGALIKSIAKVDKVQLAAIEDSASLLVKLEAIRATGAEHAPTSQLGQFAQRANILLQSELESVVVLIGSPSVLRDLKRALKELTDLVPEGEVDVNGFLDILLEPPSALSRSDLDRITLDVESARKAFARAAAFLEQRQSRFDAVAEKHALARALIDEFRATQTDLPELDNPQGWDNPSEAFALTQRFSGFDAFEAYRGWEYEPGLHFASPADLVAPLVTAADNPELKQLKTLIAELKRISWERARPYARRCGEVLAAREAARRFDGCIQIHPPRRLGPDPGTASLDFFGDNTPPGADLIRGPQTSETIRVIGVSPREQAERFSTTAQAELRRAFELAASGQATPNTAVGANFQQLRDEVRRYDLIARNPLLVGFVHAGGFAAGQEGVSPQPTFGWIISPRLVANTSGAAELAYRQSSRAHAVSATLVVPGHFRELKFRINVLEITDSGSWKTHRTAVVGEGALLADGRLKVEMSPDVAAIVRRIQFAKDPATARPSLQSDDWDVRAGAPARIVVRGENVWRSPEVFIGGQRASRVSILPDLEGLAAEFERIDAPPSLKDAPVKADLMVSTSQGTDTLPASVAIYPPAKKAGAKTPKAVLRKAATVVAATSATKNAFDLSFKVEPPLPKAVSAVTLRLARDMAPVPFLEQVVPPSRLRLSQDRKSLTIVGTETDLFPAPTRLLVQLSYTPGVGESAVSLTKEPLRLLALPGTAPVRATAPVPFEVRYLHDSANSLLKVAAETTIEGRGTGFEVEWLADYAPKLREAAGVSSRLDLGTTQIGTVRLRLQGGRLHFTLGKDQELRVPLNGTAPRDANPDLRLRLEGLTLDFGKVALTVN
ncbi:MAG: hypothetical protein AAF682_20295 [Planctomycetota bacterium]